MNIIYKHYKFPFEDTNLERIIDGEYFKIDREDYEDEEAIVVHLNNERMLLEFSKSLKATCGLVQDCETMSYIEANLKLEDFVQHFNKLYKLNATIQAMPKEETITPDKPAPRPNEESEPQPE
ncbi:hypothetical protein [Caryophanon tenue]|uniref:Uncharacterized protein n=1 Tax=Caryophanon tenue TaxID=33978 RepID=A0A1C0YMV3_9BACL|nr:hypothetical protein [Caryophanon tenue]OCS88483.1 hypothetical protein A6M13_01150 [Caryophanon tenue]